MRVGVRGRLFLASVTLVTAVIALAGFFAQFELRAWIEQRIEVELRHKLDTARLSVERASVPPDDAFADELGRALGARVTLIDDSGAVLGDSEVDGARLASIENHRTRPEVARALRNELGRDRRQSATVNRDMLYLAERYTRADSVGVVRVAADYDEVAAAADRLRFLLLMAGGLGVVAAIGMSAIASQLLSRTLRTLVVHARSLVGERFGDDDIGGLAGTLQKLEADVERAVGSLASERDRFAAVLEAMSEGVVGLDANGRVILLNAAARELLSLAVDDGHAETAGVGDGGVVFANAGKPVLDLEHLPALADLARRAHAGAVASVELELRAPIARTLLVRAAPVRAGGAVMVLHDITELRRLERVRRDFVGNVSHELRTPVSVIRATVETLQSGVDDDVAARGFLAAIDRNAVRLTRLIADLLDLTRIETGQVTFAKDSLVVTELCRCAVDNVDAGRRAQHAITIEVPDGLLAVGDARAIDQVLVNLLDNALKYTPHGGRITLRARAAESDGASVVRVEVEDDGPGIAPQHRARLFERFYRADPGRSRDAGGTGLGLAIVKHLVEGMGGNAGVAPGDRGGSVFFFTLPAERQP